tara:strand:- start:3232 stop:4407 length:1176 start_codon:yes stop_codon:yes gene_type:complete
MKPYNFFKYFYHGILLLSLTGCGSVVDMISPAEIDPPANLKEIVKQAKLKEIWKFDLNMDQDSQYLNLIPKIHKNIIYAADSEGKVSALGIGTGIPLWTNSLDTPASGGPGFGDDLVFVGTRDAKLFALNAKNGSIMWEIKVSSEVLSTPVASGGVVVIKTIDGKISGYESSSGKNIWNFKYELPSLTLHGSSSPVISGKRVFCGLANGKLVALNLMSGNLIWEKSISIPMGRSELERLSDVDATPLVFDGIIFVATYQGEIAALDETKGDLFWRNKFSTYSEMSADRYNIYASDSNGHIWAFDADNGSIRWVQKDIYNRKLSNVSTIKNFLIVGDFEGYIHILSLENGKIIGRERVSGDAIKNGLRTNKDFIFVQDTGGNLTAFIVNKVR